MEVFYFYNLLISSIYWYIEKKKETIKIFPVILYMQNLWKDVVLVYDNDVYLSVMKVNTTLDPTHLNKTTCTEHIVYR